MIEKLSVVLEVPAWSFLYAEEVQKSFAVLSDKLPEKKKKEMLGEIFSEIQKIISKY